jgi:hypothetical protein
VDLPSCSHPADRTLNQSVHICIYSQCHGLCCTDDGYCPTDKCSDNWLGLVEETCDWDGVTTHAGGGCPVMDTNVITYYAFCDYTEYGGGLNELGRVRCRDINGAAACGGKGGTGANAAEHVAPDPRHQHLP